MDPRRKRPHSRQCSPASDAAASQAGEDSMAKFLPALNKMLANPENCDIIQHRNGVGISYALEDPLRFSKFLKEHGLSEKPESFAKNLRLYGFKLDLKRDPGNTLVWRHDRFNDKKPLAEIIAQLTRTNGSKAIQDKLKAENEKLKKDLFLIKGKYGHLENENSELRKDKSVLQNSLDRALEAIKSILWTASTSGASPTRPHLSGELQDVPGQDTHALQPEHSQYLTKEQYQAAYPNRCNPSSTNAAPGPSTERRPHGAPSAGGRNWPVNEVGMPE